MILEFLIKYNDVFDTISKIATTILAIVGVFVAIKGLSTWYKELRGKDKYNLGIDMLKTLLDLKITIEERGMHFIKARSSKLGSRTDRQNNVDLMLHCIALGRLIIIA